MSDLSLNEILYTMDLAIFILKYHIYSKSQYTTVCKFTHISLLQLMTAGEVDLKSLNSHSIVFKSQ